MKCENCNGKGYVNEKNKACLFCDGTGRTCDKCGESCEQDMDICEDCENEE